MNRNEWDVVVLGLSENSSRYSFKAAKALTDRGYSVVGLARNQFLMENIDVFTEVCEDWRIKSVTVYLNAVRHRFYFKMIAELNPKVIIFNPGTEDGEIQQFYRSKGIKVVEACTLVLLSLGEFDME